MKKEEQQMLLTDFPLAWRWTDLRYDLLPEEVLRSIRPFSVAAAQETSQEAITIQNLNSTQKSSSLVKKKVIVEDSLDGVTEWLLYCHPNGQTPITISWDLAQAVSTSWETFARHWSAFCYPASDDVTVWPERRSWTLSFHHDGVFTYRESIRD